MAIKKGKIITVSSVKGGTGKTIFSLNLAGVLETLGYKTLVIDFDLYSGGVAVTLNLDYQKDVYNLVDDLNNNRYDDFKNYVTSYSSLIDVLPSPKDPRKANKIDSKYIDLILLRAETLYDVVLIDTNHLLNESNLVIFDRSDWLLFLINDDVTALKNMRTLASILDDAKIQNYLIILNDALNLNRKYFSPFDIKNILERDIDYVIPKTFYIENINKYIIDGKVITATKMNKNVYSKFVKIVADCIKEGDK